MSENDPERSSARRDRVDDGDGEESNWAKDTYDIAWYIQVGVVIVLFVLWVVAGMPT